jgi:hypothetical protein
MHLLVLHRIARPGEGLAPGPLHLLSAREDQAAGTRIVPLRHFNPAVPDIAGAFPDRPEPHDFLRRTPGADRTIQRRRPPG